MPSRPVDNFGRPPRCIDDDEIECEDQPLADGTYGIVYRALFKDKERIKVEPQGRLVALKVSKNPNTKEQMKERDAIVAVGLDPNLVGLSGYLISATGELRLVVPYVGGGSLESKYKADKTWGRTDLRRTTQVSLHLLGGAGALYRRRNSHNDSMLF
jgi:serine/threonine protein kinase